ncbi:DUF3310 domain-containing protein [Xylophilus sp.]|uniref:DUF3310 domain-containing protein n=1 Tax=Xylophilus sp. TaxID=2653893 RepID=UPI0013BB3AA6|nr:DUF3310 domain-containing protein [Xylophilus sp.]KAF1043466.1 MAG: hypothetical protein GAK38_03963 [Xylophilus sp.]
MRNLPERDPSKPAENQGLFHKFEVRRVDGSDAPGGKHHGCVYFVLDIDHDPYAVPAVLAYADACEATHPLLAENLRAQHGGRVPAPPRALARQEGGGHYKDMAIQPVEYIHKNGLGYFEGNVVKYISRWRKKGGAEDLKKARHYIDLLLELESGRANMG